jgi:hypothetical protein
MYVPCLPYSPNSKIHFQRSYSIKIWIPAALGKWAPTGALKSGICHHDFRKVIKIDKKELCQNIIKIKSIFEKIGKNSLSKYSAPSLQKKSW